MGLQALGLARTTADGPSAASDFASHLRIEVRLRKSSTPSPEEKRAEREVGNT